MVPENGRPAVGSGNKYDEGVSATALLRTEVPHWNAIQIATGVSGVSPIANSLYTYEKHVKRPKAKRKPKNSTALGVT